MPSGTRSRTNNVFGTTTDNPLTNVATTINSAGLANLAAISAGPHAVLTLDPLRVSGAPEYVIVTAHTGSATSATITRGAYGSSARQHPLGTLWTHAPLTDDFIRIVDATGDITDPYEGQLIYEQDVDIFHAYSGSAWVQFMDIGAWDSYTPSNTNITVGNGTQTAFWTRQGRTIFVRYQLTWGSTTALGGTASIGLPVAAPANIGQPGVASLVDAGTRFFAGQAIAGRDHLGYNANRALLIHTESANAGQVDGTNPFTWTTGDLIFVNLTYEAAS